MNRSNQNLDELIFHAIGRDRLKFDFNKWKQANKKEIEIFNSQTTEQKVSQSARIFETGIILMKSPITKLAAAVVIIIAVTLSLQNGSVDVATPAFGLDDIKAAMEKVKWLHCIRITEELKGDNEEGSVGDIFEMWQSVNPSLSIEKQSDGKIHFKEKDTGKTYIYDPDANTITVKYDENIDPREAYASISDWFSVELAQLKAESHKVRYEESVLDGQPVTIIIYDFVNPESKGAGLHDIISIAVDPETYLPRQMSIEQTSKTDQSVKMTGTFDYPETGPKDIYEAGASRDAKIIEEIQDENK